MLRYALFGNIKTQDTRLNTSIPFIGLGWISKLDSLTIVVS